jgi:DNA-3-methyladenine glycosylase I
MDRCFGNRPNQQLYAEYHDHEWGVPSHDDRYLFEMLILEGTQAGLNWEIVLKKREGYRKAFYQFDPEKVSEMTDEELEKLRHNPEIIRNRLKIYAARQNAKVFLKIQKEFGSFDHYVWGFVCNKPIINHPKTLKEMVCSSEISDVISKDLKKRGMTFVGSKIIYSFLQAVGIVNDHIVTCKYK